MATQRSSKPRSNSDTKNPPDHQGGDALREAQQWSGGSKGSKGGDTKGDKRNDNVSAKT
jgi:hypothetical protein